MNRFSEPKDWDNNIWRIWGTYKPETPIALLPQNPCECFIDLDDLNNAAYWPSYEIEQVKGCEPEILKTKLSYFDPKTRALIDVKDAPGLEVLAEDYLRDDHNRWAIMKRWLEEFGERDLVKDREAA